jgi:hypothetical protein
VHTMNAYGGVEVKPLAFVTSLDYIRVSPRCCTAANGPSSSVEVEAVWVPE